MPFNIVEVDCTPFTIDRDKIVVAGIHKEVSDTTYFVGIDLSNASTSYRHAHAGLAADGYYLVLAGMDGKLIKSNASAKWEVKVGTVLGIDDVQSNIGWLQHGSLYLQNTGAFEANFNNRDFPVLTSLENSKGRYTKLAKSEVEHVFEVDGYSLLNDVNGNNVIPNVGDLIIRVKKISGAGTAFIDYTFWYFSVSDGAAGGQGGFSDGFDEGFFL